jgi:predicted transcriptional regulator
LTKGKFRAIILTVGMEVGTMLLKTRVFDLYSRDYRNLSELAEAMEISVSQVYRVLEGKRNINRKFIIGAMKAFSGYKFDDLFYFVSEVPVGKTSHAIVAGSRRLS